MDSGTDHPLKGDPRQVEAGRRGGRKRWSDVEARTHVRMSELTPEEAGVVRALLRMRVARLADSPDHPDTDNS